MAFERHKGGVGKKKKGLKNTNNPQTLDLSLLETRTRCLDLGRGSPALLTLELENVIN